MIFGMPILTSFNTLQPHTLVFLLAAATLADPCIYIAERHTVRLLDSFGKKADVYIRYTADYMPDAT